jgi:hypothetical protein
MSLKRLLSYFNYDRDRKTSFLVVIIFASLFIYFPTADIKATHLSKPIVVMDKTSFNAGEAVAIKGWVDYFGPTSDVLLDMLIRAPNGSIAIRDLVKSDSHGNFSFTFRLTDTLSTTKYTVQVISQCREEHREICANESISVPIIVRMADNNKVSSTSQRDTSNSSKRPFSTAQLLDDRDKSNNLTGLNLFQGQNDFTYNCSKLKVNVHGTQKNDILMGTNGNDVIDALDGNDIIYGLEGGDIICSENGDDLIFGGLGDDKIHGGNDNDQINGGHGHDLIDGGNGNDQINGEYGYDILHGGNGSDVIDGGPGYNQCFQGDITRNCG